MAIYEAARTGKRVKVERAKDVSMNHPARKLLLSPVETRATSRGV